MEQVMKQEILVREFLKSEWRQYKRLRLDSLLDSPDSFGVTYEQVAKRTEEEWKCRIISAIDSENDLALVASYEENYIGLAWCKREPRSKESADIFQMWVRPEYRGKGIGHTLLLNIKNWAEIEKIQVLYLGVAVNNNRAYRLYKKFGFEAAGDLEPLRISSTLMMQPMRLILSQPKNC